MSCYDARGLAIRTPAEMPMTPSSITEESPNPLDAGTEPDAGSTLPVDAGTAPQEADAGAPTIDPCAFELTVHTPRIDPRDTWSIADFNRLIDCVDNNPSNQAQYVEQFWTWDAAKVGILIVSKIMNTITELIFLSHLFQIQKAQKEESFPVLMWLSFTKIRSMTQFF